MTRVTLSGFAIAACLALAMAGCEDDDDDPVYLGPVAAAGYSPGPPYKPGSGGGGGAGGAAGSGSAGAPAALAVSSCAVSFSSAFRGLAPTDDGGFWLGTDAGLSRSTSPCADGAAAKIALPGVRGLARRGDRLLVARESDVLEIGADLGSQTSCPGVALRTLAGGGSIALGTTWSGKLLAFDGGCGSDALSSSKITVALAAAPALVAGTAWVAGLDAAGALLVRKVVLGTGGDAAVQPVSAAGLCGVDALGEIPAGVLLVDATCRRVRLVPTDGGEAREASFAEGTLLREVVPAAGGATLVVDAAAGWRLATLGP